MANNPNDVIDLCDSFILVDHRDLSDALIELDTDDSLLVIDSDDSVVELSHHVSISVNVAKHSHIPKVEKQNRYLKPHLPSHIFNNKKNLTNNQNTSKTVSKHPITLSECPICFEILGQNPLASTKCGHVYCMECIKKHLLIDRRCPTCRKYLKGASSYHSLYLST